MHSTRALPILPLLLIALSAMPTHASLDLAGTRIVSQGQPDSRYDLASQPEPLDRVGESLATGDFNGDGYQDLAIGVPWEDDGSSSNSTANSGWVSVIYGTPTGLDASPGMEDAPWDQDSLEGGTEPGDRIGLSLAVGDFNGDGFDDLVLGVPYEAIGSEDQAGAINVIYGSSDGLQTVSNRQIYQERSFSGSTVPGAAEADDNFGFALAAGDFDGDGRDDLAVGIPGEDIESLSLTNAGTVLVFYGNPIVGLLLDRSRFIDRASAGMRESPKSFDRFGRALASGDFNGDGKDDLAIGVPYDDRFVIDSGTIDIVYGSSSGLDPTTNRVIGLGETGFNQNGPPGAYDYLGFALAVGDFDGDSYDDLAAGLPYRSTDTVNRHGAALIVYGSGGGLVSADSALAQRGRSGLTGVIDTGDQFGAALAVGDLNGDGADDLAVRVSNDDIAVGGAQIESAGSVHFLYGQLGSGLRPSGNQIVDYSITSEDPAEGDLFGYALALGDFDGDGADDLAASARQRDVRDANGDLVTDAGAVAVIPGIRDGGSCVAGDLTLCLAANRFRVEVEWTSQSGVGTSVGVGNARPRTSDSGFFWFFDSENIELVVKVLDARGVNGHFWVFYGALSDVGYTLRVTDTETGQVRTYTNPQGTFASIGDTTAFADSSPSSLDRPQPPTAQRVAASAGLDSGRGLAVPLTFDEPANARVAADLANGSCTSNQLSLCLNDNRFFVQVNWRDFKGNTGNGKAVPVTGDTGAFWFFDDANLELVLKVLDARAINGHFWVYFGALSNVEFEVTVLDTQTGRVARYENPLGTFASEGDTTAIPE